MTEPTLWPAPVPKRGARIRHGWRCTRTGGIGQTTRRTPAGVIVEVETCLECKADDLAWRITQRDLGGDAA